MSIIKVGFFVVIISCVTYATSGIAVSCRSDSSTLYPGVEKPFCCTDNPRFGKLHRYIIENDSVISDKVLDTNSQFCSRWATLNISGTKCAYFSETIGPNGGGGFMATAYYVTVIDIDGKNRRNLVDLKSFGGDGTGYMDWPKGDWIYFNIGGIGQPKSKEMWRVNEKTGVKELIATLPYATWVWNMSANADKIVVVKNDDTKPCANGDVLRYNWPVDNTKPCSDASISYSTGCTAALSPSGSTVFHTTDAGHSYFGFTQWASNSQSITTIGPQGGFAGVGSYNAWAVNCSPIKVKCADDSFYTVGNGTEENRWSANSDKWVCFNLGWQPAGRQMECSANQVLINWQDHKTIMVSFNPRVCVGYGAGNQSFCPTPAGFSAQYPRTQEAGDFVVTAPESEINADLRQYVKAQHRIHSSVLPTTNELVMEKASNGRKYRMIFAQMSSYSIDVYSVSGRLVASWNNRGLFANIDISNARPGLYTMRSIINGSISTRQLLVR